MELISVSALEIRFDNRPDDDVLLVIDELVNVLRTEPGCMNHSIIALHKNFSSMIISGFWNDQEHMIEQFSSSSFTTLMECLTSNCRSISFRSLFMETNMRGQHAEP